MEIIVTSEVERQIIKIKPLLNKLKPYGHYATGVEPDKACIEGQSGALKYKLFAAHAAFEEDEELILNSFDFYLLIGSSE